MNALTRTQKWILLVLAVLDIVVIGGLAAIVLTSPRPAHLAPAPTATQPAPEAPPTWTPTPTTTPRPTLLTRPTNTPTPTASPYPTPVTPTPTVTPTRVPPTPVRLNGADFDFLMPNRIPGWTWDAYINYLPGDVTDPEDSYAEPMFTAADDAARQIDGTTLKVETIRWLKFRTWVHQTVTVTAGSQVTFRIQAKAFSSLDRLIVKAGIDPTGADNCYNARWGPEMRINQDDGTVTLSSPVIVVPALPQPTPEPVDLDPEEQEEQDQAPPPADDLPLGRVTLCFFAEPTYPHVNNAAFFDRAEIAVSPPR